VLLVVAGHLLVASRYGVHRDEMYFVACGSRLAAGYVDHPPFVPMVARAACALGGCDVAGLRLGPLLARIATVVLTLYLVRALRGGLFAEVIAGLAVVFAPAFLRMGKILCIPVFEPVFWTGGALILLRLSRGGPRWWWLALGAVVGLGTLNKHTMLIWGLGAAVGTLMVPSLRLQLRSAWPWLGVLVAVLVMLPNVVWQRENHWATLEFLRTIRTGMLAEIPRALFALGQLLYMHPFAAIVWLPGLWLCILRPSNGGVERAFGVVYLLAASVFLLTRGKPYYLAPAYPPLLAVGAVAWERWLTRFRSRAAFVATQVTTGLAMAALTLPVLSLPRMDAAVGALLGSIVPPIALTHDLHDEYGWRELANTVAEVWRSLPPEERSRTEILTSNYGEAAALEYFGASLGLPKASSGHMTYFLWGPTKPTADTVLAVGHRTTDWLAPRCARLERRAVADHPLAVPGARRTPVALCRGLNEPLGDLWPELKRYDHSARRREEP
jgi:4-amino-4-deoxy-L-arabinose transferase-like glycosyltransferase